MPGSVNVMTAGIGISHAEEIPPRNSGRLNGVQLWTALPDIHRNIAPAFQQVDIVPEVEFHGGLAQVFSGTLANVTSPAQHYSEIVGADLVIHPMSQLTIPLNSFHEHAVLLLSGDAEIEGQTIVGETLYYLGTNRDEICFRSNAGARLILIGGLPFKESILMWWNFVARTPEEIAEARTDWEAGNRFGEVTAYKGQRLSAPPLAHLARPNPMS